MGFCLSVPVLALAVACTSVHGASTVDIDIPSCKCGNGKLKLWGPGGPHTAFLEPAALFNKQQAQLSMTNPMEIEICWGPEDTWRSSAMECAGGFFTGAQQQMGGFLRVYEEILDESTVMPITLHVSTILVNKGNPKGIESINDLFVPNQNIKLVVNDGNYHDTLTSATGLWEDVVGRSFDVEDIKAVRDKIIYFAKGSGDARDTLLGTNPDVDEQADAWITWNDWAVANSDVFDEVPIDLRYIIARDVSIVATDKTIESNVVLLQQFCDFLQSDDDDVNAAMQGAGFHKSWAFSSP